MFRRLKSIYNDVLMPVLKARKSLDELVKRSPPLDVFVEGERHQVPADEALVLKALLETGRAESRAMHIADTLNARNHAQVPDALIYEILGRLVIRGFVKRTAETRSYSAIPGCAVRPAEVDSAPPPPAP